MTDDHITTPAKFEWEVRHTNGVLIEMKGLLAAQHAVADLEKELATAQRELRSQQWNLNNERHTLGFARKAVDERLAEAPVGYKVAAEVVAAHRAAAHSDFWALGWELLDCEDPDTLGAMDKAPPEHIAALEARAAAAAKEG